MQEIAAPISASEDFSLFAAAWGVPAVFWAVGGTDPDTFHKAEIGYPLHSSDDAVRREWLLPTIVLK